MSDVQEAAMRVVIVHLKDATVEVHKAGCQHLRRLKYEAMYTTEAETRQQAANEAWADFVDAGSMGEAGALADTHFAPCTGGLR